MNETAEHAGNVAFIVIACFQLLATAGFGVWLIKKASNNGENIVSLSERIGGLESVFEYMRKDHEKLIRVEERQDGLKKDMKNCFDKIREIEDYSQH